MLADLVYVQFFRPDLTLFAEFNAGNDTGRAAFLAPGIRRKVSDVGGQPLCCAELPFPLVADFLSRMSSERSRPAQSRTLSVNFPWD